MPSFVSKKKCVRTMPNTCLTPVHMYSSIYWHICYYCYSLKYIYMYVHLLKCVHLLVMCWWCLGDVGWCLKDVWVMLGWCAGDVWMMCWWCLDGVWMMFGWWFWSNLFSKSKISIPKCKKRGLANALLRIEIASEQCIR